MSVSSLSYPIGPAPSPTTITEEMRRAAIDQIAGLPTRLRDAVAGLSDAQLDTPYRPGGWTVRQVVHHVADSHMNAYVRIKLALTEETPTITPYNQESWVMLPDSRLPVDPSLAIVDGLHARWAAMMRALPAPDFARGYRHPEYPEGPRTLDWAMQHYGWHARHHVAHITALRQREGW